MEELNQESPFIIKDDNFSIDIIVKYQTPNGINKKGITIYKKNCEINFLNDESLSNSVINIKKDNNNIINSFANIGFISISDIICFLYLTKNDIILLHESEEYTYYKVKNVHYIKMIEINNNSDNEDLEEIFKQHFDQFKKYFVSENLFFSFCKYGNNILSHHIDSTNNICFNEKYFLLFKQTNAIEFITPLIKGFYTHLSIVNRIIKGSNDIKKDNDKEHEDIKEDNNKDDNSNNNNNSINIDIMIKYKINQAESNLIKIDDILNEDECIQEIEVIIYRDITDKKINYKFYSYSGKSCNDIDKLFQLFKADKNIIKGLILISLDFGFNNTGNNKGEDLQKLNEADIFDVETTNDSKKNSIKKFVSERIDKIKNIFVKDRKESEDDKDKNIIYDKLLIISGSSNNSIFNLTQEIIQSIVYFYYEQNFNKDNNDDILISKAKSSINNFFDIIDELLGKRTMKLIKLKFPKVSYVNKEYIKSNLNVSLNISLSINNNAGLNLINGNNNNKALNSFSIYTLTYNVCGMNKEIINSINFSELLFPEQADKYISSKNSKKKYPLFFCIGLEEVINLNAKNVIIGGEKEKYSLWEEKITSELKSKNNYVLLTKSSLVGILFFIFVQASEVSKISNIKSTKTKTGFYGQLGNKGSCFVEFEYKNKKYGFNSGHLAAGENIKSNNERKINLLNILNHKSDKSSQEFYQNDFYFILGDLNFRVKNSIKIIHKWLFNIKFEGNKNSKMENINENKNITQNQNSIDNKNNNNNIQKNENENKDVESNVSSNYTSNNTEDEEKLNDTFYHVDEKLFMKDFGNDYLKYDQLNIYKEELTKFNIKESNILFYPTYKYAKESNNYNLSKREPSWTDRILFKGNKSIKSVLYNRINVDYSDHKPVFSIFEINY